MSFLALELPAAGTDFQAENSTRTAIEQHVDGFQWMIYANNQTSVTHWDLVSNPSLTVTLAYRNCSLEYCWKDDILRRLG